MVRASLLSFIVVLGTIGVANAGFFGPDDFVVKQSDNRFSVDHNPTFVGQNNRISSKSIAGGTYINSDGMYVEPMVTKELQTKRVIFLGVVVANRTSEDTKYGDVNSLGAPQTITFLLNESRPIVLQIRQGDTKSSGAAAYNSVGNYASVDVVESGIATLTVQQYQNILAANSVAVRIQGSKRTVTYETDDISKSFLPNLKTFFANYVQ
jgi:hypothetical protein